MIKAIWAACLLLMVTGCDLGGTVHPITITATGGGVSQSVVVQLRSIP